MDAERINLDEARKQAEKRLLVAAARPPPDAMLVVAARHKLDAAHDGELLVQQGLRADVRYRKSKLVGHAWHQPLIYSQIQE
jgi:hypothetical protein